MSKEVLRFHGVSTGWTYWFGGLLLALLNIILFAATQKPWGISLAIAKWGVKIARVFGSHPEKWAYFQHGHDIRGEDTWMILGMIAGSLLSTLLSSDFRWIKIRRRRQIILALGGGALMGFGARLAHGCNVGAFFSAISSQSLHGWVFAIFVFAGAYIGVKLLTRMYL
ncbi:YeeE/YedE thiosulfate transporter family protein [Calderihabitans maritimus]|uniref:Uncharacterized protein n=1 Tax=Calderihabitans maritimus TaxID=1246530 RepID=A0A1Z5HR63_9FIRM|nr:YeeE/YedE thiosulfate transporter family protein [Calderihabitans maritimus]GAW92023.1 hypothetical protein Thit_0078 [Calderihabitans maritimus]